MNILRGFTLNLVEPAFVVAQRKFIFYPKQLINFSLNAVKRKIQIFFILP